MNKLISAAAVAAVLAATSNAHAGIIVDGILDAAYGAATGTVLYDASAPSSNFGAPSAGTNAIGYNVYLSSDADNVYGFLTTTGPGVSAGTFANLYFDLDGNNGATSDIGFEITNGLLAIYPNTFPVPISYSANGGVIEFSIPNTVFATVLAGAPAPYADKHLTLRMSQSFGYSVAVADGQGLGTVTLGGPVPEPATWAMMIAGFGLVGAGLRRRRRLVGQG